MPVLTSKADDDFYFFPADEPDTALARILELDYQGKGSHSAPFWFPLSRRCAGAGTHESRHSGYGAAQRGTTGSLERQRFRGGTPAPVVVRGGRKICVGDKVMQIRNNYDKDVYNGDIGLVTDINTEDQAVHVDIDGNDIVYDYAELDELVLAYAVSIHKSQGSEYPVVVIPVMTQHYVMLQRNLVYTGITRGKKLVVLVGTKKALGMAVRNNRIMQRNSWLWGRLRGGA